MSPLQLHRKGSDQLREILDILPKRGNEAFDIFYQVLVNCEENIAADLLCPERAEKRKAQAQQSKIHLPVSGVQESPQVGQNTLPDDDELPGSENVFFLFKCS